MKKLLILFALILALAGFFYYYFSTPKILERRLESLMDTLSFGVVSLKNIEKEGDHFASHFASEVTFSGAGNEIISGTVEPNERRELYLEKYRVALKSAQTQRIGEFFVKLTAANEAEMEATLQFKLILRDNTSYPQEMPTRLQWIKEDGKWVISEVQLQLPTEANLNFS